MKTLTRPVKRLLSSWAEAKGQVVASIEIEEIDGHDVFLVTRFESGDAIVLRGEYNMFGNVDRFDCEPFTVDNIYSDDNDALRYFGLTKLGMVA